MTKRHYVALLISLAIHGLLVFLVPGFGRFEWDQLKNNKRIEITLSSRAHVEPKPEEKKQSPKSESSGDLNRKEQLTEPTPKNNSSNKSDKSRRERSESSEQSTTTKEKNRTESKVSNQSKEVSEGSSKAQTLLTRKGRFTSPRRGYNSNDQLKEASSVLRNDASKKIQVNKVRTGGDNGTKQLRIIEPKSEQTEVYERRVSFKVKHKQTNQKVDVREFVEPTKDSFESDRSSRGILSRPVPNVPRWLEEKGDEVKVSIRYTVNPAGTVTSAEILSSSGYAELDQLLLDSVGDWKYEAGEDHEKHVVVFKFKLSPADRVS